MVRQTRSGNQKSLGFFFLSSSSVSIYRVPSPSLGTIANQNKILHLAFLRILISTNLSPNSNPNSPFYSPWWAGVWKFPNLLLKLSRSPSELLYRHVLSWPTINGWWETSFQQIRSYISFLLAILIQSICWSSCITREISTRSRWRRFSL